MHNVNSGVLSGKLAVITGSGRGIGAAIARRLAMLGATTVLCGRTKKPLEDVAAEIGPAAKVKQCDVSNLASVQELASFVEKNFGRTDILVNNAGVGAFSAPLHELTPEEWEKVLNTNLRGVYYCIRAFAPMMIRGKTGDIVNISSLAGKNALPNGAAYAAS